MFFILCQRTFNGDGLFLDCEVLNNCVCGKSVVKYGYHVMRINIAVVGVHVKVKVNSYDFLLVLDAKIEQF